MALSHFRRTPHRNFSIWEDAELRKKVKCHDIIYYTNFIVRVIAQYIEAHLAFRNYHAIRIRRRFCLLLVYLLMIDDTMMIFIIFSPLLIVHASSGTNSHHAPHSTRIISHREDSIIIAFIVLLFERISTYHSPRDISRRIYTFPSISILIIVYMPHRHLLSRSGCHCLPPWPSFIIGHCHFFSCPQWLPPISQAYSSRSHLVVSFIAASSQKHVISRFDIEFHTRYIQDYWYDRRSARLTLLLRTSLAPSLLPPLRTLHAFIGHLLATQLAWRHSYTSSHAHYSRHWFDCRWCFSISGHTCFAKYVTFSIYLLKFLAVSRFCRQLTMIL